MTVIEAANIYQILVKFSELYDLIFNDALSIIKLKNNLKDYYELVENKKRLIFMNHADIDSNGNIKLAKNGSVMFKTKEDAELAIKKMQELNNQKVNTQIEKIKIVMPEKKGKLTLQEIEMLALVIDFQ